jgi:hypothetical protein
VAGIGPEVTTGWLNQQAAGAAAVLKDSYPVRWVGRQAVVLLPACPCQRHRAAAGGH